MVNNEKIKQNLKNFFDRVSADQKPVEKSREEKIRQRISEKYSIEDEIALINNYNTFLLDNSLTRYKEEYLEYLQYRNEIKKEF